jgi:Trypsin-like peptidase domain
MATDLPTGEGMEFDADTFVTLDHLTQFNSVVVPVVVVDPKQIRCVGTAFDISPSGLFVTARHVIDEAEKLCKETPDSSTAVLWVGSGEGEDVPDLLGGIVTVSHFTKDDANGSDLGLLRAGMLKDGEPYLFPICRLSARVAKVGTKILAMGYARFNIKSDTSTEQLRQIVFEHNFSVSTGEVLQVFREGRDTFRDLDGNFTGRLPTVCFETSARFDPGMSGGPVFDENFSVCGIIATGLESDELPSDRSFASGTPYLFTLGMTDDEQTLTVYQMVQQQFVECDAYFERLVVSESGGQLNLSYPCED